MGRVPIKINISLTLILNQFNLRTPLYYITTSEEMLPRFLALCFLIACFMAVTLACDCDYHSGGCTISKSAQPGFKCRCVYKGFWTCSGHEIGCDNHEASMDHCIGNCYNPACCYSGGGDCGGY